jgi:pyruvate dehydrogenase E2 component (dihydrolipoamide acetyltransferase)
MASRQAPSSRDAAPSRPRAAAPAGGGTGTGSSGARAPEDDGEHRGEVKASPAARKIAAERGIDLRTVRGSGPDGRVVKQDVQGEERQDARSASDTPAPARDERPAAHDDGGARRAPRESGPDGEERQARGPAPSASTGAAVSERHELSRMRQTIARRMSEAFRDIPHFYVTAAIDMTEVVRLKQSLESSGVIGTPITYTHMILKAVALALKRHPRLNASFRDGAIEIKGEINIGLAVAVEDGLIVPILRHVDELSLEDIAVEARRLAEQAKRGRFASEDLSGGTFTVSNMGMLDIEEFAAVINPPQAAILAVGAIKERPIVRDGAVVAARTMRVTLSCDHRIIDGVVGGRFLEELKRLLENPIGLIMREHGSR